MDKKQIENNNHDKIIDGALTISKTVGRQLMIIEGTFVLYCFTNDIDPSNNLNLLCVGLIIFTVSKALETSRKEEKVKTK